MLRQMQHIQHAGEDPTAAELRFSTADLLQALKVQITGLLPGLFNPSRRHESLVVAEIPSATHFFLNSPWRFVPAATPRGGGQDQRCLQ